MDSFNSSLTKKVLNHINSVKQKEIIVYENLIHVFYCVRGICECIEWCMQVKALKCVIFNGFCDSSITFKVNGVLKAPIDPSMLVDQKWINFRYVDKLTINGGGTFDGQGTSTRQKCQNIHVNFFLRYIFSFLCFFFSKIIFLYHLAWFW